MNALSFRLSPWYSSGVFALIVVILTSVYIIVFNGVFPLTAALFSSVITLPVSGDNNNNGYDGLLIALDIKPDACSLGGYSLNIYDLPV